MRGRFTQCSREVKREVHRSNQNQLRRAESSLTIAINQAHQHGMYKLLVNDPNTYGNPLVTGSFQGCVNTCFLSTCSRPHGTSQRLPE